MSPESTANDGCALRLFVAIPVPPEIKASLREVQTRLKRILLPETVSWTKPHSMHLTLRFLGNVAADRQGELAQRIRGQLAGLGSLELVCERLGCFPGARFPRVVWAWVHEPENARLTLLQGRVEAAVAGYAGGAAAERFVGHITLARLKRIRRTEAEALRRFLDEQVGVRFGRWRAETVELIRSELTPQGSRYTTLDVFRL